MTPQEKTRWVISILVGIIVFILFYTGDFSWAYAAAFIAATLVRYVLRWMQIDDSQKDDDGETNTNESTQCQEKDYFILFNTTDPNGSFRCVELHRLVGLDSMNGTTPMEAVKRMMRLLEIAGTPIQVTEFSYCTLSVFECIEDFVSTEKIFRLTPYQIEQLNDRIRQYDGLEDMEQ